MSFAATGPQPPSEEICNDTLYFDPVAVLKKHDVQIENLQFDISIYKTPGPSIVSISVISHGTEVGSLESWRKHFNGKNVWESSVAHLNQPGTGVGTLLYLTMARLVHDLFEEGFVSTKDDEFMDDAGKLWERLGRNNYAKKVKDGSAERYVIDSSRLNELTSAAYSFVAHRLKDQKKFNLLVNSLD